MKLKSTIALKNVNNTYTHAANLYMYTLFWLRNLKVRKDGRIILQWIFWVRGCELDLSGLRKCPLVGCCDHDMEQLKSVKDGAP